jgi:Uma2 family endonuclease
MAVRHPVTAAELEEMGTEHPGPVPYDFELVRGALVVMTPAGGEHGVLTSFLTIEVGMFARSHGLGRVYAADTGFMLASDPDTVLAPDVSFVSLARQAGSRSPRGFIPGAPDLAVEVRSPGQTLPELGRKASAYLAAGCRLVWLVDPAPRQVLVHQPGVAPLAVTEGETLSGGDVLPGFSLELARLFAELD